MALVGLKEASASAMRDALRECGLECRDAVPTEVIAGQDFSGCVLQLEPGVENALRALRHPPARSGLVLIGVCAAGADPHWYSGMGLNAVVIEPVTRAEALRAIHAAQLLISHSLRRHVRVPIVVEVRAKLDSGGELRAVTRDVSFGGMSLVTREPVYPGRNLEAALALPDGTAVSLAGTVIWRLNPELIGVRFSAEAHPELRRWIEAVVGGP